MTDEVISKILKCKKLIRPANRSEGGLLSVEGYISNKTQSNSDDSMKVIRTEIRATKESSFNQQFKFTSRFKAKTSPPPVVFSLATSISQMKDRIEIYWKHVT